MMKSASKNKQVDEPDEEMLVFSKENARKISGSFRPFRFPKSHCNMIYIVQFPDEEVLEAYNIRVEPLAPALLLEDPPVSTNW